MLHKLTFAELIRYAEYAQDEVELSARMQAIQYGLVLGLLKPREQPAPIFPDESDAVNNDDGGISELIKANQEVKN